MPFTKQGKNDYTGPSGRHFNLNQVRLYYARGGKFAKGGVVKEGSKADVEPRGMREGSAREDQYDRAQSKVRSSGKGEYAAGGVVLGRTENWMKSPDRFHTSGAPGRSAAPPEPTEDQYPKTGTGGKMSKLTGDKSLPAIKPRS